MRLPVVMLLVACTLLPAYRAAATPAVGAPAVERAENYTTQNAQPPVGSRVAAPAVTGRVVARDGGEPLGYTTIRVTVSGAEHARRLTREDGTFVLGGLP